MKEAVISDHAYLRETDPGPNVTAGDTMVPNPGMDGAGAEMPPIPAPGKRGACSRPLFLATA